jgi:hypothetical protein
MSPRPRDPPTLASEGAPRVRPGAARRARVRRRWALVAAAVAVPGLGVASLDGLVRAEHLSTLTRHEAAVYGLWTVIGAALWGALLYLAIQRRTRLRWLGVALLVCGALLAVGGQSYMFSRYRSYLDHRAVLVGTSFLPSVGQQLWSDRAGFARHLLPPLLAAVALTLGGRRVARYRKPNALFALDITAVALMCTLFGNVGAQCAPPDVLYLSAMGQLARARWDHNETVERVHPGVRTPLAVPALVAHAPLKRNVIYVLTESVRAQSVCLAYDPDCKFTPFSNPLTKGRHPLTQMRALDSTTAISIAIMWTGLLPTESREALHSAPLLWEYLKAAGLDGTYWTSQNMLFGNSGIWLGGVPFTKRVSATELDADATMEIGADDGKLVDYALGDLAGLKEPYLGVVHLSNTHFPYKIDPTNLPFQPQELAGGPGYETELTNRYQDAIYLQDMAVARLIKGVRARPEGDRTVIVFVSDHGEQMREKGGVAHTGSLWDPEVRIPFWIDAPKGTLTGDEEAHLRAIESTPLTNLDVLPTLLDLMGLLDEPQIASMRARMPGHSLLRGGTPELRVAMSNCTELWACAFKNWGAIQGSRKLISHQGMRTWGCFDTASDPGEDHDLGPVACGDLIALAEGGGRGHPW